MLLKIGEGLLRVHAGNHANAHVRPGRVIDDIGAVLLRGGLDRVDRESRPVPVRAQQVLRFRKTNQSVDPDTNINFHLNWATYRAV